MTLDEFEGTTWGDPPEDATYVQHTCYELRRTPLGQFEAEDLRIMIGQQIGLELLVPMALGALIQQPLIEADMYPGDLLRAVLALPDSFWHSHPAEDQRLRVAVAAFDAIDPNDPENPAVELWRESCAKDPLPEVRRAFDAWSNFQSWAKGEG